jgi:hypothetical protein
MNNNIRQVLSAIELLRDVSGCELEVIALSHKAKAMFKEEVFDDSVGINFINCLNDEQLRHAFLMRDKRLDMFPFPNPEIVQYMMRNGKGWALNIVSIC